MCEARIPRRYADLDICLVLCSFCSSPTANNSIFLELVYARVSSGYNFLNSTIEAWKADAAVNPPSTSCDDLGGFYDSNGVAYNCMWYGEDELNCEFSNSFPNGGITANEACCACGGGIWKSTHTPTRSPTPVPTSRPTTKRPTSKPTRA